MSSPADPLQPDFVIHGGRRGGLTLVALAWAGIAGAAGVALAVAISQPSGNGPAGAGVVVLPALAGAFSLLALAFTAGQWWDDATHFRIADDRLEARHGGHTLHGRPATFELSRPVTLVAEGSRDAPRLFVEQDRRRVDLGRAQTLGTDQLRAWESWMRAHGGTVDRASTGPLRW